MKSVNISIHEETPTLGEEPSKEEEEDDEEVNEVNEYEGKEVNEEEDEEQDKDINIGMARDLSKTSKKFDVGEKGYLTPAEQQMRALDVKNEGQLNNAQVREIVNEALLLQEKNKSLRTTVFVLVGLVVVLSLSNLGTAFAAAKLAQDTTVDSTSGRMTVRDGGMLVSMRGEGQVYTYTMTTTDDTATEAAFSCVSADVLTRMWNSTKQGTRTTVDLTFAGVFGEQGLDLVWSDSLLNATHICYPTTTEGVNLCVDYTDYRCDATAPEGGRALTDILPQREITHHHRRHLFLHALGSSRYQNEMDEREDDDDNMKQLRRHLDREWCLLSRQNEVAKPSTENEPENEPANSDPNPNTNTIPSNQGQRAVNTGPLVLKDDLCQPGSFHYPYISLTLTPNR